ncbi:DUF308 domain-containing protein [Lactobacillus rodentium]|uniref:Membrane protein n=1 Tax=Lactobacillus rodentium TaxID=947835 RepID=A0A2Z6TRE0_9LACO|nr:DUF308 domain-containing protein [Lactobacillus rodentium]MCR1895066.1 DUF308 domain-containing protein [Lactobacillus rodentium]GBG05397.1 membrane protein [Lactobacillus rodentium]
MNNFSSSDEHRGFDWGAFIGGVLLIIAGFIVMAYPDRSFRTFVYLFGIISILQGILWIYAYAKFRDVFSMSWVTILSAIIDIIIGILFLCSNLIGGLTLAILFAIWFLADSIIGIIFSVHLRAFSTGYFIFSLILSIISLIIAIVLLFNPMLAALTMVYLVAFWLLVFGFNELMVSWMHR